MRRLPPLPPSPARGAGFARFFAALALSTIIVAAAARRFDAITTETLLVALAAAFALATIGLVFVLVTLRDVWQFGRPGVARSVGTLILVALAFSPLIGGGAALLFFPPIDRVATDPADPPALPDRIRHVTLPTTLIAPEDRRADLQADAYPDILPLPVDLSTVEAFALSRTAMTELGWEIRSAEEPETEAATGRIVAETRSLVLGIPVDIVAVMTSTDDGARIDLISASRYPIPDLGSNARNIRAFMAKFRDVSHRPA